MFKLEVHRSPTTGDWWIRGRSGNHRIVGTSQEGYRKEAHARRIAKRITQGKYRTKVYPSTADPKQWRWGLVASNGKMVFGSHENLTQRRWAETMSDRIQKESVFE